MYREDSPACLVTLFNFLAFPAFLLPVFPFFPSAKWLLTVTLMRRRKSRAMGMDCVMSMPRCRCCFSTLALVWNELRRSIASCKHRGGMTKESRRTREATQSNSYGTERNSLTSLTRAAVRAFSSTCPCSLSQPPPLSPDVRHKTTGLSWLQECCSFAVVAAAGVEEELTRARTGARSGGWKSASCGGSVIA